MQLPNENKALLNRKHTLILLIAAGVLLVGAMIWSFFLNKGSIASRVARELSEKGCSVRAGELYQHEYRRDTSIREMMGETDLSPAVEASVKAGFPSDIDKKGEVYCLLAETDKGVLTVFLVDERIELAFIQIPDSDEVLTIGEKEIL
jgi:hypothetical protein